MEQKSTTSRRDFLRNALALVVVSAAAPSVVLGRIMPEFGKANGQMVATYTFKVSDFGNTLISTGGSIKLGYQDPTTPDFNLLKLNPDHNEHFDVGLWGGNKKRGMYPIAVTRVAESGTDAFKAVSTYCSHGEFYQVDYKQDTPGVVGRFVCSHEKSTYEADGTHVKIRNTPDVGNLRTFPTSFDGENVTLTLAGIASVLDGLDELPTKTFLDQNYPNPFNPSTIIRYGLPDDMRVRMTVHTLLGKQIKELFDEKQEAGIHFYDFSAADLPSGVYFYRLETPAGTLTRRMTVSK